MITQVKSGQNYINVSIAVIDNDGCATDPTSAEAWFYKVSQIDGSIILDPNIGGGTGKVALLKQDGQVGFWGESVDISLITETEYVVLFKTTIGPINSVNTEFLSIENGLNGRDWSDAELEQIRDALGIDGLKTSATNGQLQFLMDIEGGRWKIESNQMIFYKSDNITVVATFDLFNEVGDPTEYNVRDRRRV